MKDKKKSPKTLTPPESNSPTTDEAEAAPVRLKKRKTKSEDPKFSLRAERRRQGSKRTYVNPLHLRTDHSKTKVSLLVGASMIPPHLSPTTVKNKVEEEAKKTVPNYRPLVDVEGVLNKNKEWTPKVGYTPEGKTRLERAGKIGENKGLYFFKEKPLKTREKARQMRHDFTDVQASPLVPPSPSVPASPSIPPSPLKQARVLTKDSPFYQSAAYLAIKKITCLYKSKSITIDDILRSKVARERQVDGTSRNQAAEMLEPGNKIALGSATKYAEATELFTEKINVKWEWLHLVAHMIMGRDSQDESNLVCGKENLNSWMLLAEREISYLETVYPGGFTLEVGAHLIAGTHIANSIEYFIATNNFRIPFLFNAEELTDMPHYDFGLMLHAYVKTLVVASQEKQPAKNEVEAETEVETEPALKRPKL